MLHLDCAKILYKCPLSTGAFGTVYPYKSNNPNAEPSVVKIITCEQSKQLPRYLQEIVLSFNHDSPFILRSQGFHVERKETGWMIYIKMRKMEGSLESYIKQNPEKKFSEAEAVRCLYRLAYGLKQLQNMKIAHRDIKPANILVDKNANVWIADLGLSAFVDSTLSSTSGAIGIAGTANYMAPECIIEKTMKKKELYQCDAWSLGITMLEICVPDCKSGDFNNTSSYLKAASIRVAQTYGNRFARVLSGLLRIDPDERSSFDKICEELEDYFPFHLNDTFEIIKESIEKSHRPIILEKLMHNKQNKQTKSDLEFPQSLQQYDDNFNFERDDKLKIISKDPQRTPSNILQTLTHDITEGLKQERSKFFGGLALDFSWCKNLEDKCLAPLDFQLLRTTNLNEISLNFSECNLLTDETLALLSIKKFNSMKSLESLSLDFSGCQNITNQGLLDLVDNDNGSLSLIKKLSLSFCECDGISFKASELDALVGNLRKLSNLKYLSLNFLNCSNVNQKMKSLIGASLGNAIAELRVT